MAIHIFRRLLFALTILLSLALPAASQSHSRKTLEFSDLLALFASTDRPWIWGTGSEEGTAIRWQHDGIVDCEAAERKLYGTTTCRSGLVILTIGGQVTHTILKRTIQPADWKVALLGESRHGPRIIHISSDVMWESSDPSLLKSILAGRDAGLTATPVRKCGGASFGNELHHVKSAKSHAFVEERVSCGSGGCSYDLVLTTTEAEAQKLFGQGCPEERKSVALQSQTNPPPIWDDGYISRAWRIVEGGIQDSETGRFVLETKAVNRAASILSPAFVVQSKITATDMSGRPLQREETFLKSSRPFLVVTIDNQGQHLVPNPLEIVTPVIADRAGVRVGSHLHRVPGYDWRKLCRAAEGMWSCRSAYSRHVHYTLVDHGGDTSQGLQTALRRYPVARITLTR